MSLLIIVFVIAALGFALSGPRTKDKTAGQRVAEFVWISGVAVLLVARWTKTVGPAHHLWWIPATAATSALVAIAYVVRYVVPAFRAQQRRLEREGPWWI